MNKNLIKTIKELIIFSAPIALGQISQMLIGLGDVFVAGHHSRQTVAAIGIANGLNSPIFLIGLGLLLGISPTLSKKRGESANINQYFYTCIAYAVLIGIVFMSITMLSVNLVPYLGFDKELVPLIKDYLFLISFSYIGAYIFIAAKEYLQAMELVVFANSVSVVSVFANVGLCYVLVFGVSIFPSLGVRGLAYATIIIRSLTGVVIFIYALKHIKPVFSIIRYYAAHVFKFSIPISMSIFIEVLAFSVVMILIGRIGALYAAIHSISMNLASTTYMIPLAISSATSVKVAYFYGRRNLERVKDFIKAGLILSITFMACAGLCLYFFPQTILGVFTPDREIITAGAAIIMVCAMFQIFDGTQVTLSGVLRGLGITKPTSVIVLFGYWAIGLPLGYYLGYILKLNALGFWIGLAVSIFVVAISLLIYLLFTLKKINKF